MGRGGGEGPIRVGCPGSGPWVGGQGRAPFPLGLGRVKKAAACHSSWVATALGQVGVKLTHEARPASLTHGLSLLAPALASRVGRTSGTTAGDAGVQHSPRPLNNDDHSNQLYHARHRIHSLIQSHTSHRQGRELTSTAGVRPGKQAPGPGHSGSRSARTGPRQLHS